MKTMTCNQLGGACDKPLQAETFEEMVGLAQQHGMEMFQNHDEAHTKAMAEIRDMMQDPKAMEAWRDSKRSAFDALPESN